MDGYHPIKKVVTAFSFCSLCCFRLVMPNILLSVEGGGSYEHVGQTGIFLLAMFFLFLSELCLFLNHTMTHTSNYNYNTAIDDSKKIVEGCFIHELCCLTHGVGN